MKIVFDSDVLIDFLQGLEKAKRELVRYPQKGISIVSWMEILAGRGRYAGRGKNLPGVFVRVCDSSTVARHCRRSGAAPPRFAHSSAGRHHLGDRAGAGLFAGHPEHEGISEQRTRHPDSLCHFVRGQTLVWIDQRGMAPSRAENTPASLCLAKKTKGPKKPINPLPSPPLCPSRDNIGFIADGASASDRGVCQDSTHAPLAFQIIILTT